MESNGISTPLLPDDIILEILSKVSLKSLYRLKWVSKSWFSLITNEVLTQLVNSPNLSFYYTYYRSYMLENKSSKSLDFLPHDNSNQLAKFTILDCCCGLVFCYNEHLRERSYYVCNPVDKSYNQILSIGRLTLFYVLDFNPLISPHYKLIFVHPAASGGLSGGLDFNVYRSEKRCFKKVHICLQNLSLIIPKPSYIALWNGNVYLHCAFYVNLSTGVGHRIVSERRFIMISGVLGGSEENIIYKFINFPKQSMVYTRMPNYMGTWRDRLRFVSIDDHEIRVWALRDNQEDEWTLEHDCPCFLDSIKHSPEDKPPNLVGLHPLQNAVLFMFKNSLFAYDLDRMLFEKICEIEDGATYFPGLVFPYSPCFAKEVLV